MEMDKYTRRQLTGILWTGLSLIFAIVAATLGLVAWFVVVHFPESQNVWDIAWMVLTILVGVALAGALCVVTGDAWEELDYREHDHVLRKNR